MTLTAWTRVEVSATCNRAHPIPLPALTPHGPCGPNALRTHDRMRVEPGREDGVVLAKRQSKRPNQPEST